MCSAFAHVIADTMRTLTVMGCAILVWAADYDSQQTDAIGSLVVCIIILGIAGYICYETAIQLKAHLRSAPPQLPRELSCELHTIELRPGLGERKPTESCGNVVAPGSPKPDNSCEVAR